MRDGPGDYKAASEPGLPVSLGPRRPLASASPILAQETALLVGATTSTRADRLFASLSRPAHHVR